MDRRVAAKLEARRRRHGGGAVRCSVPTCAEMDPRALTGAGDNLMCAEHRAVACDRPCIELHHVAGQHNGPTVVPLLANWHARLTHEQQSAWPRELLRNPDGDPLLRVLAAIRGSRETTAIILDDVLGPLEVELFDLRAFLADEVGPDWATSYRDWRSRAGR